jgi:hypothetical protein
MEDQGILEPGSHLQCIEKWAFSLSSLTSIILPHSVEFVDESGLSDLHLDFIGISTGESQFHACDPFLEDIPSRSIVRYFRDCKSVAIPSSVEVLCKSSFSGCMSLSSITFEPDSHLQRIDESAFLMSGLTSIVIPSSVGVLCKAYFDECRSLSSITFEPDSHLQRIDESAFCGSDLTSILIPSSVDILCKSFYDECRSFSSITFEPGSDLRRIEKPAFSKTVLKLIILPSSVEV